MLGAFGILLIFVMVFGGYLAAGGKLDIIFAALPFEMMIIGGAAAGAFLIANGQSAIKTTLRDIAKVFKGPKWKPDDYRDLLCLLFTLIRLSRQNPVAIEAHIEQPDSSSIFAKYPRILADPEAVALIGDTLRSAMMNYDDPHQVEEVLEKRMEVSERHGLQSSHALQTVADGLPGPRDRRRRARRDQDHGLDRSAHRGSWCHDRWRAGRHVPGRASVLLPRGPACRKAAGDDRV